MKIKNICIPCATNFALRTLKLIGYENDENLMKNILKEIIEIDYSLTPAHLGTKISRCIKYYTGVRDPFKEEKIKQNEIGKEIYHTLKEIVRNSKAPMIDAIKISCIGNSIDLGATGIININFEKIKEEMNFTLNENNLNEFLNALENAKSILFITDNAGEIFFDKVFLDELKKKTLYISVKSEPIINDMTIKEVKETELDKLGYIIETGTDSLGVILDEVNDDFKKIFYKVDMVIAKGHANFETLMNNEREVFFMLKAKCDYVSEILRIKTFSYFVGKNNS